jgi:hypothetical protein
MLAKSAVLRCHQNALSANGHPLLSINYTSMYVTKNTNALISPTMFMITKINSFYSAKIVIILAKIVLGLTKINARSVVKTIFVGR